MKNDTRTTNSNITRRRFLQRTAGGAAVACCVPAIVPSSVFGANAPNERINVAFIGLGNQSRIDLPAFLGHDDAQVVAVCDVNRGSNHYLKPEHFLGREPGQKTVNEYYAKKTGVDEYKGCAAYGDFREVLARPDVDAVVLIVPDHWHALMTVAAAKAGKDIYCEKPLSLCIRQGQQMVKAVRQYKRVLQTGSMQRSSPHCRFACELARNGYLGDIKRIFTDVSKNNFTGPGPGWKPMPVPDGFDYETWLGPAPEAPYHEDRCLYRFRFIRDYSGGQTTNFGAHSNDLAQWALGKDGSGPIEFEDQGSEFPEPGSLYNTPTKIHFRAKYDNGVELVCQMAQRGFGIRIEGTKGWVDVTYNDRKPGGIHASPESLLDVKLGPNDIHLTKSTRPPTDDVQDNYVVDHSRNFLDCIKTREDPIAKVEIGHSSASLCHLGNICMLLHRKIRWDPANEQIIGDDEAAAMLSRPMRAPWALPEVASDAPAGRQRLSLRSLLRNSR
jgi:predicted dehydrogenase